VNGKPIDGRFATAAAGKPREQEKHRHRESSAFTGHGFRSISP
jgi:hypothetical protein